MNQRPNPNPNPFDDTPPPEASQNSGQKDKSMEVLEVYNPETKVMLERFTLMLIAVGVIIGAILSVGIVYILEQTGLTATPNEVQMERTE